MDVDEVVALDSQRHVFGDERSRRNMLRNVDALMADWDGGEEAKGLTTLRPLKTKADRQYFVYAPLCDP